MKLVIKLLVIVMAAFGLHAFYNPTTALGERWGTMARYAIGILGLYPFFMIVNRNMRGTESETEDERVTVAYFMAAGAMGTGVFMGHILDRVRGE